MKEVANALLASAIICAAFFYIHLKLADAQWRRDRSRIREQRKDGFFCSTNVTSGTGEGIDR